MSTTPADQPEPIRPADENHDIPSSPSGTDESAADVHSIDGSDGAAASTPEDGASAPEAPEAADLVSERAASSVLSFETGEDPGADEAPATLTAYPDAAHPVVLDRDTIRRAPRFGRFALAAVLGGLLLGVIVGYVIFPASHPGWSRTIFAFEVMLVTLAVTLLVALASDRRSRRPRRR
ncbi:hypothetical protein IGS67_00510 [Flavimobilis sp. GY10621]|uniref:Uncharacterized protein n=1 Tax=Flavimobilis rhizosphaerae TaxID=2775421 RepID=A0ABR9DLF9_9MICO|nr:hypothetical protein [Flavimobilis rhizosphaerae]MBD9697984.1 hypothetical protein [Flavimobilis rhizosphaerae]